MSKQSESAAFDGGTCSPASGVACAVICFVIGDMIKPSYAEDVS